VVKSEINLLLLEDNPGDARLIIEMLKESRQHVYNITVSENIVSAISNLGRQKFDVILSDLNLTDSSGLETLNSIIDDTYNLIPIIVMTGINDEETGVSAIELGAEDYIVKGEVNSAQLIRSIRYAMERHKNRCDLQESEERFRELHESMIDAFVQVDMKGNIVSFNSTYLDMLGYTPDEIKNLTYVELTPEKWHAYEADIVKNEILVKGFSKIYEKEYVSKNGELIPVELRTYLLHDNSGNPAGMCAIVRDITERKQSEKRILDLLSNVQEEKNRLSSLINNITDEIWFADKNGNLQ
jgi:PAS domain S-box-containing protein